MKYFVLTLALFGASTQGQAPPCTESCWQSCPIDRRCPATNLNTVTLLSHPTNCSKYISCESGHGCERVCPAGLHFNAKEMICDWPARACCDASLGCGSDDWDRNCLPHVSCIGVSSAETVLLPHPTCSKFYKCDRNEACEYDCPQGLHFNKLDKACDWPARACCDKTIPCDQPCIPGVTCPPGPAPATSTSAPITPAPTTIASTTVAPTTLPPGGDDCNTGCPDFNCHVDLRCLSTVSDGKAVLLSHYNCGKFYKCKDGSNVACELDCPPGLHFNERKLVCDWPWLACCDPSVQCVQPCIPGSCSPSLG
ncbi:probable chitinase 10 [Aedes aegypti]|uniref:Chitin-binding type-2 domain-containing protein n=1 Tax=Aedes aegypti TaxID=7159 RepID=A0A1S4FMY2_AEDAE|nr:probable chitinase 10 [Aedes aegypti]